MIAARVVDLSTLTPSAGFIIQGDAAGDQSVSSVSSGGEGFDDMIVGASFGDDGGYDAGEDASM